jgi:hypothetical protein
MGISIGDSRQITDAHHPGPFSFVIEPMLSSSFTGGFVH